MVVLIARYIYLKVQYPGLFVLGKKASGQVTLITSMMVLIKTLTGALPPKHLSTYRGLGVAVSKNKSATLIKPKPNYCCRTAKIFPLAL